MKNKERILVGKFLSPWVKKYDGFSSYPPRFFFHSSSVQKKSINVNRIFC
jgi:hypothetical protein